MTPAEALLEVLRDEGVEKIFGNPGTTELPLLDVLAGAPDLDYVLAVQELSAVAMADGYARATGRTAFVNLHVAAGLANGLIGMLNARRSRVPMVVTAGQQDRRHLLEDPMLAGDLVSLATAAAKDAVEVQHARDLPTVLRRAFALAALPPAGPVFVSIPMDLLVERTDVAVPPRSPRPPSGPAAGLDRAAEILTGAARPAVVAGDGVGRENAVTELVTVAERLGATVYHQPMHDRVNFPFDHPRHAGMLPPRAADIHDALKRHDVVLVAGMHTFNPHHYTPGPAVPPGVRVVQIDSEPAALGRTFAVELGLAGDVRASLAGLAARLPTTATPAATRPHPPDAPPDTPAPLDPGTAARTIAAALPPDAVVVDEAITVGVLLRPLLRLNRPGSFVHTAGGGLGWGIGAAVGTRMGAPERPVVAVLGDGCAMFGLQGLWSAARYRVPVTFLVMNNGEYRTLKDTLGGHHPGLDLALPGTPRLDWLTAARFFGVTAARVGSARELHDLVATPLDEPLLVDVPILARGDAE